LDRKIKASQRVNKPAWRLQIGTFRKLLLMTCSRRLKVWLLSLLGYRRNANNANKKYSCGDGMSRGKLPLCGTRNIHRTPLVGIRSLGKRGEKVIREWIRKNLRER
jgi:hypothetical protein